MINLLCSMCNDFNLVLNDFWDFEVKISILFNEIISIMHGVIEKVNLSFSPFKASLSIIDNMKCLINIADINF
jgi:hypothetical protein